MKNERGELYDFSQSIVENAKMEGSNAKENRKIREICLIEVAKFSETHDEWYAKMFDSVKNGQNSENYMIKNTILYHRFDKCQNPFENEWKICVPSENRSDAIFEQHDSILASHPGYFKTLRRLQNIYYWPKMAKHVYEYVRKCEICRTTKSSNENVYISNGSCRATDFPFRSLSCDFIGPLTMKKLQKQYLFVVVDNFSKYL